jgi:hypothetical protein
MKPLKAHMGGLYLQAGTSLLCSLALISGAYAQAPAPIADTASAPVTASQPAAAEVPSPLSTPAEQPFRQSLFFSADQLRNLNYAVNVYRKNFQGKTDVDEFDEEDFLSKLSNIKEEQQVTRFYQYPQFYLESIVYHAQDNWIVWVNGQKITQSSPTEHADLQVESISRDAVVFLWRPTDSQKVYDAWVKADHTDMVKVMGRGSAVKFSLRPNQTFSSYVMRVLEGKVKPVTTDTQAVMTEPANPPEDAAPDALQGKTPSGEPASETSSDQGLPGLIGAYRRLGDTSGAAEEKPATPAIASPEAPSR